MNVYVFGNKDLINDNRAINLVPQLLADFPQIHFIFVKPNEDLPFINQQNIFLFDVVLGLDAPTIILESEISKISLPPRNSTHDFDLAFQLKYLKKLGKLGDYKLIAIPYDKDISYDLIHSIFKKLVEQDIQGS